MTDSIDTLLAKLDDAVSDAVFLEASQRGVALEDVVSDVMSDTIKKLENMTVDLRLRLKDSQQLHSQQQSGDLSSMKPGDTNKSRVNLARKKRSNSQVNDNILVDVLFGVKKYIVLGFQFGVEDSRRLAANVRASVKETK